MRPSFNRARGAVAATGAFSVVTLAAALGAASAQTPDATATIKIADRSLVFGQKADVRGRVSRRPAGTAVRLQLASARGLWSTIATRHVGPRGRYRAHVAVPASGALRAVVDAAPDRVTQAAATPLVASRAARIAVAADVVTRHRHLNVLARRAAVVHGTVRPAGPGRQVMLERRTRRGWATLDRSRTRRGGGFALRAQVARPLSAAVRVRAARGDRVGGARERIGRLNVFRRALVSWYGPGFYGNHLGCGGILHYGQLGVAHKTLPCGTMVTLRNGSRMVRVPVIDRGPYVGAREFDLTAATKDRLGFSGVGTILVSP